MPSGLLPLGEADIQYPGVRVSVRIRIRINKDAMMLLMAMRGITITTLAGKAGLSQSHTIRIFEGTKYTTPETAKRIQRALATHRHGTPAWEQLFALASTGTETNERPR